MFQGPRFNFVQKERAIGQKVKKIWEPCQILKFKTSKINLGQKEWSQTKISIIKSDSTPLIYPCEFFQQNRRSKWQMQIFLAIFHGPSSPFSLLSIARGRPFLTWNIMGVVPNFCKNFDFLSWTEADLDIDLLGSRKWSQIIMSHSYILAMKHILQKEHLRA